MAAAGLGGDSGLLASLTPMAATAYNYTGTPEVGTGIKQFLAWAGKHHLIQPGTIEVIVPSLPGLFGGYPQNTKSELGVNALFIGLFGLLFLAHLLVWVLNLGRAHFFHLQLGFAFFCAMKVVGYACRLVWAQYIPRLNVGIVSVVFIQVPQLILLSLNMVLAHRIFTWRHPETGRHWAIVHFLNLVYFIVLIVIAMAIVGQVIPYLYFLGHKHFNMCKNTMKAAAVLNLFYAFLPVILLIIAWILPPGTIVKTPKVLNRHSEEEERVLPPVYQASWVKGANLFYYPGRNTQIPVYKGEPAAKAVRIIPSREPPGNGKHRQHDDALIHPSSPQLKWAIVTVTITSFALVLTTCLRVAACFRTGQWGTVDPKGGWKVNYWPHKNYVMWIFYGAVEVAVLSFYLLMRVDLRFYIPDMPRKRSAKETPVDSSSVPPGDRPVTWTVPANEAEIGSSSDESKNNKSEYHGTGNNRTEYEVADNNNLNHPGFNDQSNTNGTNYHENISGNRASQFDFSVPHSQNYHDAVGETTVVTNPVHAPVTTNTTRL